MSTTRGSWFMRDRPVVIWLGLAILVALVHPFVDDSRWIMVHLVVHRAVTHSIKPGSYTQNFILRREGVVTNVPVVRP